MSCPDNTICALLRNAEGLWACELCGWVYPIRADLPPRRNCPALPGAIEAARRRLVEEIQQRHRPGLHQPLAVIAAELEICLACPRWALPGRCTRYAAGCDGWDRWLRVLLRGLCPRHRGAEPEPINMLEL